MRALPFVSEVLLKSVTRESKSPGLTAPKSLFHIITKQPLLNPYNRLAASVVALNLLLFISLANAFEVGANIPMATLQWAILLNFSLAIVIRQQDVINLLFAVATSAPTSWPLSLRWALGKVYHFGGLHVGAFLSGTLWLAFLTFTVAGSSTAKPGLIHLLCLHLAVLTAMSVVALPKNRARHHNVFEVTARFGGWASLLLFWIQTLTYRPEPTHAHDLFALQILVLASLTFCVALPWMRMRKVPICIHSPSRHVAITRFNYGVTPFAGSSTDLSRSPWLEWHSFANVPSPGVPGFRLTISRAGDWTGALIDDRPSHLWVKGIPAAGVGNIEKLFKRVVWVATGSGIGPCLPHLLSREVPSTLVWSTKNPNKTYGDEMVDEILKVQPDALIWDTDARGKPNLIELALHAFHEFNAEAVICIANKKVTWNVVYEMESRGIPAFGAIWDS